MMSCALKTALKRSVRAVSSAGDTAHCFQSALHPAIVTELSTCAVHFGLCHQRVGEARARLALAVLIMPSLQLCKVLSQEAIGSLAPWLLP
jgi:hypothetical protein